MQKNFVTGISHGLSSLVQGPFRPLLALLLAGLSTVMANPAGPAYFGGGCSIGTGMVWGFLAGEHAAALVGGAARVA